MIRPGHNSFENNILTRKLFLAAFGCSQFPNFLYIVCNAHQIHLNFHVFKTIEQKLPKTKILLDVPDHRLNDASQAFFFVTEELLFQFVKSNILFHHLVNGLTELIQALFVKVLLLAGLLSDILLGAQNQNVYNLFINNNVIMPATPPIPEQEPKILSFEDFTHRDPVARYNNLFLYFAGESGEDYRKKAHYQRFAQENPEMAGSLCDKIQNQRDKSMWTSESLKPFDQDLYEAYKIMRSYGVSDRDLFA